MQTRYHLRRGDARTTVSLDNTLSGLLAIKLSKIPETKEGHTAVRQWLQYRLDQDGDLGRQRISQWLTQEVTLFIADKILSEGYLKWLTRE